MASLSVSSDYIENIGFFRCYYLKDHINVLSITVEQFQAQAALINKNVILLLFSTGESLMKEIFGDK